MFFHLCFRLSDDEEGHDNEEFSVLTYVGETNIHTYVLIQYAKVHMLIQYAKVHMDPPWVVCCTWNVTEDECMQGEARSQDAAGPLDVQTPDVCLACDRSLDSSVNRRPVARVGRGSTTIWIIRQF